MYYIFSIFKRESEPSALKSSIEDGVRVVRESCCDCVKAAKDKKKPIDEFVTTGIEHSQCRSNVLSILV